MADWHGGFALVKDIRLLHAEEAWLGKPGLSATVRVFNVAFFRKIIMRHDTGLGEAYMDSDYEVSCQSQI